MPVAHKKAMSNGGHTVRCATAYPAYRETAVSPFGSPPDGRESTQIGLYNYGHRYYDARLGRWLSRDPIGESGGLNNYTFAGNNGVNRWDRLGQRPSIIGPSIRITPIHPSQLPANDPFGTSSRLELDQISEWEGKCGNFEWLTRWTISPASEVGGVVVQHLVKTGKVWDCKGNDVTPSDLDQNFRELWTVSPGRTLTDIGYRRRGYRHSRRPGDAHDDTWQSPRLKSGDPENICTKGYIVIIGSAMFFEGGSKPANFIRDNPDTQAGTLPSTTLPAEQDTPPIAGFASNVIQREAKATWDCCGENGEGIEADTDLETRVY